MKKLMWIFIILAIIVTSLSMCGESDKSSTKTETTKESVEPQEKNKEATITVAEKGIHLNITADNFLKSYNNFMSQIDDKWVIDIEETENGNIKFTGLPETIAMRATKDEDDNLTSVLIIASVNKDEVNTLKILSTLFATAQSINPNIEKDKINNTLQRLIQKSTKSVNKEFIEKVDNLQISMYASKDLGILTTTFKPIK